MEKRKVAVFDFDGTLTTKDTFVEFIRFVFGTRKFIFGFLLYVPLIVLMKLRLYSNGKCKQKVFSYFFKGMDINQFRRYCAQFTEAIEGMKKDSVFSIFQKHIKDNHDVYIVSASIDEWILPFGKKYGVKEAIGTKIEIDGNGKLTGGFASPNCYGQEKVNRFTEAEADRTVFFLYAYGDSRGDREMIDFADEGIWIK